MRSISYATRLGNLAVELRAEITAELDKLAALIDAAYLDGYQSGVRDGGEKMRKAIFDAAGAPFGTERQGAQLEGHARSVSTMTANLTTGPRTTALRAPRGAVRAAITAVLRQQNGLTEIAIGEGANRLDPAVSARSVGGELRRLRNRLYRFDAGKWFLIAEAGETETAEPVSPSSAVPKTATKEDSDAPETAIAA